MPKPPSPEKIKLLFANAVEKLQQGDAAGAARGFEKLVKAIPDSAVAWYNLGLSRQHLNRHTKAAEAYRRAVRLKPDHADAVVNLGLSQKELKQADAAMQSAKAALEIAPRHPRALNLAGTLHAEKNEHQAAAEAFERALALEPDNEDARHNLANAMLQRGDSEDALKTVQAFFDKPAPAKRHRLLRGQILLDLKRYGEVFGVVDELTAEFGGDEEVLLLQMSLYEMVKDYFGVIDAARELLKKMPGNARVWNSLGSAYFQLDSIDKAAQCYHKAIELAPDLPEYQNNRGLAHSSKGEKTEAERCYRRAMELNPHYTESYRNLVAMKKFSSLDDEDAQAITRLWETENLDDFNRTKLAFTLGKVYDDVGEYERAFATYEVGNRLKFAESRLDFDRYFAHIDGVPEIFTAPPQRLSEAAAEPCPIFIVGMPRSGTTLVEQIISRHSMVSGCGELPCIEKAIARLEKRAQPMRVYPRDFLDINSETVERRDPPLPLLGAATPRTADALLHRQNAVQLRPPVVDQGIVPQRRHHPLPPSSAGRDHLQLLSVIRLRRKFRL